jgi:cytoskeleton protein RodZ
MESIGEKLRTEREQKNYSVEQIARDTNIAKRYLVALETEDFSVFPGDPYLLGFLRNYAEYLGLDPEEMVSLYRNFTIQSQPLPMDELLDTRRPGVLRIILLIALVGLLGAGGYLLYPVVFGRDRVNEVPEPPARSSNVGTVYQLDARLLERRFLASDAVEVAVEDETYRVVVSSVTDRVALDVPGGTSVLRIGDERAIDLDGNAAMDLSVALADIDSKAEPPSALLRFERSPGEEVSTPAASTTDASPSGGNVAPTQTTGVATGAAEIGSPGLGSREIAPVDISRATEPRPFRVTVVFRGYCLFRYLIDGEQREERYFQKGETLELDVAREIRLWVSNAGNMIARIDGVELELGRPGEVATRLVSWNRQGTAGDHVLRMVAMY